VAPGTVRRGDAAAATVGVLALQGDFAAHEAALARFGIPVRQVRTPRDLEGLGGLCLPGGESTVMLRLLAVQALFEPMLALLRSGLPVLGTCAGMILLAKGVVPDQPSFGVLDVDVDRNGYGRQIHSGTFPLTGDVPNGTTGVFIRAPRVLRIGPGVEVLARRGADPVLLRQGTILASSFHPELQVDHPATRLFEALVRGTAPDVAPDVAPAGVG